MLFPFLFIALPPKGSLPEYYDKYKASIDLESNTFKCFDGLKVIDLSKFNNNYPDCNDASDEPGTSANFHDKFYCQNSESLPITIDRWSVGDGICDCCDGSDELFNPRVKCPNTCPAEGQARKKIIAKLITIYNSGLNIGQNLTERGEEIFQNATNKYESIKKELEEITQFKQQIEDEALNRLNEEMAANNTDESTNEENPPSEGQAILQSADANQNSQGNQPQELNENDEKMAPQNEINENKQNEVNKQNQNENNEQNQNENNEQNQNENNEQNQNENNEQNQNENNEQNQNENNKEINNDFNEEQKNDFPEDDYPLDDYYHGDPDHQYYMPQNEYNPPSYDPDGSIDYSYEEYDDTEEFDELEGWKKIIYDIWKFTFRVNHKHKHKRSTGYNGPMDYTPPDYKPSDYNPSDYDDHDYHDHDYNDYSYVETRFDDETNKKINELSENITSLTNEKDKAERSLKMENYSRALLTLYNEEYKLNEYTFTFMNEIKKDYDSYGKFKEMRNGVMVMEDGDYCWDISGNRKTEIVFICSDQNQLAKLVETSTCKYKAWFTTPAACSQESIDQLNNMTLAELESTYDIVSSSRLEDL